MKTHFLSTKYFIKGKILGYLEKIIPGKNQTYQVVISKKYTLIKWIKKQNNENLTSVGLFRYRKNKVIVKSVGFRYKNAIYEQIINEASMLMLLNSLVRSTNGTKSRFSKVFELTEKRNSIILVSEYIKGEPLKKKTVGVKMQTLTNILADLRILSSKINIQTKNELPKRSALQILITYPLYLLKVAIFDFNNTFMYVRLMGIFLSNYCSFDLFKTKYIIAHKDLHSQNIIFRDGAPVIIDPEVCVLADPETDIAHIARYFAKEVPFAALLDFLNKNLTTKKQKKKFIALTVYYSIQMMAIRTKQDPDYKEAYFYLTDEFRKIKEEMNISKKQTVGDRLFLYGLTVIFLLNKIIRVSAHSLPIVLAYHSISNDCWQYSTNIQEFINQISFIKETRRIISLEQMLKRKKIKNSISLTFDDGYKDFLESALPILNKYNIKGTLFVLGRPEKANKKELNNKKKLMNIKDIKKIKKMGWEIGFHTNTHPDLLKLEREELIKEITLGKIYLEKKLGFKLRYFAYPKGLYSQDIKKIVEEAGFDAAFTTDGGNMSKNTLNRNAYQNNRICIDGRLSFNQFTANMSAMGVLFTEAYIRSLRVKDSFFSKIRHLLTMNKNTNFNFFTS